MRQSDYKYYRATERRLYNHRQEAARLAVLSCERQEIINRVLPSVGVVQYGELIGHASDTLTGPEQQAETGLKDGNRLWTINREVDAIEARQHILDYALAILTGRERDIVKARYFDGLSMERVAELCCYSGMHCSRLRYEAICKIGAVLFGE